MARAAPFGLARPAAPTDPEVLTEAIIRPRRRWPRALVVFMRVMAIVWLAKGLGAWATILGFGGIGFEGRQIGNQAATIYFAVIDILAAVGLWLAASWGGVLWMLAIVSHLILAVFFPRFVSNGALLITGMIFAVMTYLTLSWLATLEE